MHHGSTSLKIVVVVLVVATFVQILHLFHEVLVLFIELHRIHEEFWKSRKSLWMSLKVSEILWKSLKVSESLLKVSESLLMNLTVMHSKRVLSLVLKASAEKILELCGTFQNCWKLHLCKLFHYFGKGVDTNQAIKNDTCEFKLWLPGYASIKH